MNDIEKKFQELKTQWVKSCKEYKNISNIINDCAYLEIIDMGMPVVPFILKDMEKNIKRAPVWFMALKIITQERFIVFPETTDMQMVQLWIAWGKRKKLI